MWALMLPLQLPLLVLGVLLFAAAAASSAGLLTAALTESDTDSLPESEAARALILWSPASSTRISAVMESILQQLQTPKHSVINCSHLL